MSSPPPISPIDPDRLSRFGDNDQLIIHPLAPDDWALTYRYDYPDGSYGIRLVTDFHELFSAIEQSHPDMTDPGVEIEKVIKSRMFRNAPSLLKQELRVLGYDTGVKLSPFPDAEGS